MIGQVRVRSAVRASALGMVFLASTASAQTVTLNPRWTHQSGAENWVAREVSLGNEGTEVFSQLDVSGLSRRLFTEGCTPQATPVWQSTDGQATFYQRVASAEGRSLHASARDETTASGHVIQLRVYASGSANALWSYETPPATNDYSSFDVLFSASGDKIVLVNYRATTARTEVRVFHPASATPLATWSVDTYGPSLGSRLSRDGSILYVGSSLAANVIRLDTGALEHRTLIASQVSSGHALSGAGNVFAFGVMNAAFVVRKGTNGTWAPAFTRLLPPGSLCDQVAISDDGTRLALAYTPTTATNPVVVELFDLTTSLQQNAGALLWTRAIDSTGAFQNRTAQLEFSDNGRTFAAGFWGDDGGPSPEVLIFRDDASTPAFRMDLPGSIQRLSLSADGKHLVTASKARHNTVFSGDGSIDFFDLGHPDLTVQGIPHAGSSITLRARSTPGRMVRLLSATGRNQVPSVFGTIGALHLDRTLLLGSANMGTADANGECQVSWPLSSAMVGNSLYFQTLALFPRELGQDWCKVTVMP